MSYFIQNLTENLWVFFLILQVSEEEKRIEAKLDEERFKDLYKTEDELNPGLVTYVSL